jgi:hypothetical protein
MYMPCDGIARGPVYIGGDKEYNAKKQCILPATIRPVNQSGQYGKGKSGEWYRDVFE